MKKTGISPLQGVGAQEGQPTSRIVPHSVAR